MQIAIVGPGAIGLLLTGYLKRIDTGLILVDHLPERADQLNSTGISWEGLNGEVKQFTVPVTCGLNDPGSVDLVILCVKAYHTEQATMDLKKVGYSGPVMTLQNGVGNVEIIEKNLPESPLIAGITSEGATLLKEGQVRHAGTGKTSFGPVSPGKPGAQFMKDLVGLLKNAGIDASLSEDAESLIWSKLLINVGINALTALLGVQNGMLLEIDQAHQLMTDLVLEANKVVQARGTTLAYEDPVARVEEVCRLTAANWSSMNQDIQHGRKTEISFINGAVVIEGDRLGVPCPRNDTITRLIRALEEARGASEIEGVVEN